MEEENKMPLNIRIEQAKNELRHHLNIISENYGFPGCIIDLIIDSIRGEKTQQSLSFIAEQIVFEQKDKDCFKKVKSKEEGN